MKRDAGFLAAGFVAGLAFLLLFGEMVGSRVMRLGAHMRNASAAVNEYDGIADMQYIEALPAKAGRKGK